MLRIIVLGLAVLACTARPVVAPAPQPSAPVATPVPATTPSPMTSPTPVGSPPPTVGPGPSTSPDHTPAPSTGPPDPQRSVLRIGVTGDPDSLGLVKSQEEDWKVELLFDRLYELDSSLRPQASLAFGMPEISADGSEWTVRLRDGVRFHDGSPLDANDVAATFELLGAETCTATWIICLAVRAHLESVEAADRLTVRFHVRPPAVAFLADALAQAPILPSDAMAEALADLDARLSSIRPAELRAADRAMLSVHEACGPARWWPVVVETSGCEAPPEIVTVVEKLLAAGLLPVALEPYETQTDALSGLVWELARIARAAGSERMARALPLLPLAGEPIGSGPYRFEEWTAAGTAELVASDDWWGGRAVTPTVTIRWFVWSSDEDSLSAAVGDGEIDWVPQGAARSQGPMEPLVRVDSPGHGVSYLALNGGRGSIFSDVNVRLALDRCVDRADIVQAVTFGAGHPVRSPIHSRSWAFAGEAGSPVTGPEEARRLLEGAGWEMVDGTFELDGRRLEADLGAQPGRSERIDFLERLADAARPCGFALIVHDVDLHLPLSTDPLFLWRLFDGHLGGRGTLTDPDHAYDAFHQAAIPHGEVPPDSTLWNIMRWQDQVASDALDAGRATHDPAARLEAYRTFQERLEAEMPVIWGWADGLDAAISAEVTIDGAPLDLSHPRYSAEVESWSLIGP